MTTPKYRTTTQACSCLGFWYRRTCKHYRAYREARALVQAQDAVNLDTAEGRRGARYAWGHGMAPPGLSGGRAAVSKVTSCNL